MITVFGFVEQHQWWWIVCPLFCVCNQLELIGQANARVLASHHRQYRSILKQRWNKWIDSYREKMSLSFFSSPQFYLLLLNVIQTTTREVRRHRGVVSNNNRNKAIVMSSFWLNSRKRTSERTRKMSHYYHHHDHHEKNINNKPSQQHSTMMQFIQPQCLPMLPTSQPSHRPTDRPTAKRKERLDAKCKRKSRTFCCTREKEKDESKRQCTHSVTVSTKIRRV